MGKSDAEEIHASNVVVGIITLVLIGALVAGAVVVALLLIGGTEAGIWVSDGRGW